MQNRCILVEFNHEHGHYLGTSVTVIKVVLEGLLLGLQILDYHVEAGTILLMDSLLASGVSLGIFKIGFQLIECRFKGSLQFENVAVVQIFLVAHPLLERLILFLERLILFLVRLRLLLKQSDLLVEQRISHNDVL